jgi:hypothetical protein
LSFCVRSAPCMVLQDWEQFCLFWHVEIYIYIYIYNVLHVTWSVAMWLSHNILYPIASQLKRGWMSQQLIYFPTLTTLP